MARTLSVLLASVTGLAFPNPDGTIGFGLTVVTVPGGAPVHVDADITLASLSGAWRDSTGATGSFAFAPGGASGGSPRPPVSATLPSSCCCWPPETRPAPAVRACSGTRPGRRFERVRRSSARGATRTSVSRALRSDMAPSPAASTRPRSAIPPRPPGTRGAHARPQRGERRPSRGAGRTAERVAGRDSGASRVCCTQIGMPPHCDACGHGADHDTMRGMPSRRDVWRIDRAGSLDRLTRRTEALPDPAPGHARVAVKAVGLNFADIFACLGLYSATPSGSFIPGLEFAGIVEALGPASGQTQSCAPFASTIPSWA